MGLIAFEGYEAADYERIMPDLEGFETLQANLLGEWLDEKLQPKSVIDVGCGSGFYLFPFRDKGVWCLGVDAMESLRPDGKKANILYDRADLRLPYEPPINFDLALCLEVAEHIPAEFTETLFDTICACSDTVVFSGATPGQKGEHHHNERPTEYWMDLFSKRGYEFHPLNGEFRTWLRSLTKLRMEEKVCGWLIDHTFILQKQ